jgi:3-carboxy-cis,cis-muconate cycloisomerase
MFDALFAAPSVVAATDERAWVEAMLAVEAALARSCAQAGLIPAEAAAAITASCQPGVVDPDGIWPASVVHATPVIPLVEALRATVPAQHRPCVHYGATSQDIVDTAMMLVAVRAVAVIAADLAGAMERLDALAEAHGTAPQLGRTLMRPAVPTTFGAVVGGWHSAVAASHLALRRWQPAVQLGGPVGDRATFGGLGDRVADALARELDLADAPAWHTDRGRVVELGAALGIVAGTLAKLAGDVILLSQAEIGELDEGSSGGSSAMPGKRNPARAVLTVACAHRVPALVSTLFAGMPQELQRAAGRWQAEWPTVTDLLRLASGATWHARAMLADLSVDVERMRGRT